MSIYSSVHGWSHSKSIVPFFRRLLIVTSFFSSMQRAMTSTGLTLGFYGGIAVLGWVYQLLFMPETKNKTLEEIDLLFSQPTMTLVRQNIASIKETTSAVMKGNFREAILPTEKSVVAGEPDNLKA